MKVLLIQPEYKGSWPAPPLGLGYIASSLRVRGHTVDLIDLTLEPMSKDRFQSKVRTTDPDLVGISLMVKALPAVKQTISYIREVKDVKVVIGGPQVTIEPEFTLKYVNADYAVVGEGEDFMDNLTNPIIRNKQRKNIDEFPFPAWDLIPPSRYNIRPVLTPVKSSPIAPIITTRGCPYSCSFCGGPLVWGKTFRMRSAENIVDEIQMLKEKHGVREIFISDDNFTLVKNHAISLCKEMINRKVNLPWACPNGIRVDTADSELLDWMSRAGCYLVGFGIESGNQSILDRAHKKLDLKCVYNVVKIAKSHKLMTYGFFIIGLPGETPETIKQTIDLSKRLCLDRAYFNILIPYPGTEVYEMYRDHHPGVDWENIDSSTGMIADGIQYDRLTGSDLVYWQRRALKEFYFRPRIFLSVINNMTLGGVKTLMNTSFFNRLVRGAS